MVTERLFMLSVPPAEIRKVSVLVQVYALALVVKPPDLRRVFEQMRGDHLLARTDHEHFPGDIYRVTPAGWTAVRALEQGWM